MRKALPVIIIMILVLSLLAGCGKTESDEDMIKNDLEDRIEKISMSKIMNDYLSSDDEVVEMYEACGLTVEQYLEPIMDDSSLEVGNIKVEGNRATAEVIMTVPDFEALYEMTEKAFEENNDMGEIIIKVINEETPVKTLNETVAYTKVNGKWTIADPDCIVKAINDEFGIIE